MALSKFQQAFKDARASGETEFEFNGKKYNTKYKEEAPAPAKKAPAPEAKQISSDPAKDTSKAPAEEKPYRSKNLTDLIGLSSNVKKTTAEPTRKEDSKEASGDKKSWWTTPNANLQRGSAPSGKDGSFPSGKEIRAALGSSYKKGGSVSSASKRADGIAQKGKTRGKMC
jgi:hypothetical protein